MHPLSCDLLCFVLMTLLLALWTKSDISLKSINFDVHVYVNIVSISKEMQRMLLFHSMVS